MVIAVPSKVMKVFFLCIFHSLIFTQCLLSHRLNVTERDIRDCGETGDPLFLTPFIEDEQVDEAKLLARVPLTEDIGVESYAGYFTVNKTFGSNQFVWYFPSMRYRDQAPVLVWLQGGPGASSLFGQFMAHGPIKITNETFERREIHWALNHHVIYIDNPVGTGFSFTRHSDGYCTDETQVGEQLYSTLTQFFQLFPELQQNELYIIGESYGGKFATALSYTIHKKNPSAGTKINLKGFGMGNGLCDPKRQFIYSKYLYQIGLIDWNAAAIMEKYESKMISYIVNQQFEDALKVFAEMFMGNLDNSKSFFQNATHFNNRLNFLHTSSLPHDVFVSELHACVNKNAFRQAVHVGKQPFNGDKIVKIHMRRDIMQSVAPLISELLGYYRVLNYNGQLDIILPYIGTVDFLRHLNFSDAGEYEKAARKVWQVGEEVAGYVKQGGKLTEILVRNAGHMVPMELPERAWDMVTRFTHNLPFDN